MKSKYLTNFDKSEEPLYREAIRRFGNGVYIDSNAYWKDGHKDNNLMALKCIEGVDLYKFWKIVDQLKCSMKSEFNRSGYKMNATKQEYLEALSKVHNDTGAFNMIESLINRHFAMIDHMKETSLYDVYMYEERFAKNSLEPMKILSHDNERLKKEINKLRQQLGLGKKYKD